MTADPDSTNADEIDDLIDQLEALERTVDDPEEREQVEQSIRAARRVPVADRVSSRIRKYTSRDVAETAVGGIVFSLPMLVEGGTIEVAEWFARTPAVAGVPIGLLANTAFVVVLTVGLLYWADFREIDDQNPLFGLVPRRLIGVLLVSLGTAVFLLVLWGRHAAEDPTQLELLGRISVVWAAAALGGALGDILPGESEGYDLRIENVDEIVGVGAEE